jgi:hypothetical protein
MMSSWSAYIWPITTTENFIMNIEKRNIKMFSIITVVVLAAILLTAFGGFMMHRQTVLSRDSGMGINRGANPMMQPESAQTGPTGRMAMSMGILLLVVGFGVLVLMLWVWRTRVHRNPS